MSGRKKRLSDQYMILERGVAYREIERQINEMEFGLIPELSDNHQRILYLLEIVRFLAHLSQAKDKEIKHLQERLAELEKSVGFTQREEGTSSGT